MDAHKIVHSTHGDNSSAHEPTRHECRASSEFGWRKNGYPTVLTSCGRVRLGIWGQQDVHGHFMLQGLLTEHISANEYATARDSRQMPSQDQTMTGGPPEVMPTTKVPPRAVQQVTILKLKPTMPRREKERLSSIHTEYVRYDASSHFSRQHSRIPCS